MDSAFTRFDRILSRPLGVIPDFAVLIAGLSAKQSVSETARLQTALETEIKDTPQEVALVGLFAEGRKPDAVACSFSIGTAKRLTGGKET